MTDLSLDSFCRYLNAKKSVDDRSLNFRVYQRLIAALAAQPPRGPLRVLEVGCGLGTMVERLWDWALAAHVDFTAVDQNPALLAAARRRLQTFAEVRRLTYQESDGALRLAKGDREWLVTFVPGEALEFCREQAGQQSWDLLLAHAFLDLVDLEAALPPLLAVLAPAGLYYFTLIFDGQTIFQPPVDPDFESEILQRYHRSMDEREGGRGGHSESGRRLLAALTLAGGEILAAGSSDWVVWPTSAQGYRGEEAYFLGYLLTTIHQALAGRAELDQDRLRAWVAARRDQMAAGRLTFIAHQIDLCGRR